MNPHEDSDPFPDEQHRRQGRSKTGRRYAISAPSPRSDGSEQMGNYPSESGTDRAWNVLLPNTNHGKQDHDRAAHTLIPTPPHLSECFTWELTSHPLRDDIGDSVNPRNASHSTTASGIPRADHVRSRDDPPAGRDFDSERDTYVETETEGNDAM
jgi:hypothetical protein